jgi:hypothetical protein
VILGRSSRTALSILDLMQKKEKSSAILFALLTTQAVNIIKGRKVSMTVSKLGYTSKNKRAKLILKMYSLEFRPCFKVIHMVVHFQEN